MKLDMTKIGDNELLAYVDGQLTASQQAQVEAWLADHPQKAAEVAEWQAQSEAINKLYDHAAKEPIPPRLDPHAIAARTRPANDNNLWRMAAAAVVILAIGTGIGWFGRGFEARPSADGFITAAIAAHELFSVQKAHAVEVPGEQTGHLTAWLSDTLDRRLAMPDLSAKGYTLLGGRILPTASNPAAQIMYETPQGKRVSLYLTPRSSNDPDANHYVEIANLDALYWASDAVTCTIVGDLARAEMEDIASEVFKALSWRDARYSEI